MKFLVLAALISLASADVQIQNIFEIHCKDLMNQIHAVGDQFGTSFEELGTNAVDTGNDLLTQALIKGQQLNSGAATELAQDLLTPTTGRRDVSVVVQQKAKEVLNSFATDLKDKLTGEYTAAVRELQALAFESLILPHDQLKQKVQQIISSHSHQMTVIMENLPADLVKFVEKALLNRRRGPFDGRLRSLTKTASQLAEQFLPHVQNMKQMLNNLGQILTGTATRLSGEFVSTMNNIHHRILGALSGALQRANGLLLPEKLTPGLSGARK